jgi:hypothetical protein
MTGLPRFEAEGRPQHDWFSDGQVVRLRLFPEWSVDVPVFPRSDDTDALIPEALLAKLIAWNLYLNQNCHWESGWKSQDAKDKWIGEVPSLVAQLTAALAGKAELVIDLWPENTPVTNGS